MIAMIEDKCAFREEELKNKNNLKCSSLIQEEQNMHECGPRPVLTSVLWALGEDQERA